MKDNFRCGEVAIVGRPNVGKSTLLNHILGTKLAITSRKAQTTRHRLLGIHTTPDSQFLFLDTPGFQQKYQDAFSRQLNKTVAQTVEISDVVVMVIEPIAFTPTDLAIIQTLHKTTPTLLAINKTDNLKQKTMLMNKVAAWQSAFPFSAIIPLSARHHLNIDKLLAEIRQHLPQAPARYPADILTDRSERFLAIEIVREKLFRLLGDELPYNAQIELDRFEQVKNLRRIFCTILVEKSSYKPMIIGVNGEKLKQISMMARQDMVHLFNGPVYLYLWVKVRPINPLAQFEQLENLPKLDTETLDHDG